jgi:hypothetical protein
MMTAKTPKTKADITGASLRNPSRYRGANSPTISAVGEPFEIMTEAEQIAWHNFTAELPWLNRAHRAILHLACILRVKVTSGSDGINYLQVYSAILSKLGASPADESRVGYGRDDDEPDEFFDN